MDDTLTQRSEKRQRRRQSILFEIAGVKREKPMPVLRVNPKSIKAFTTSLCEKLLEPGSKLVKGYLKLLISEIRLEGNPVLISRSYAPLAHAVTMPHGHMGRVPRFVPNWLPIVDTYRTLCMAPSPEVRAVFQAIRDFGASR
jgi:hypothetical protein